MMGEWMDGAGIYIGGGCVYGPCMHVRMNASWLTSVLCMDAWMIDECMYGTCRWVNTCMNDGCMRGWWLTSGWSACMYMDGG